MPSSSVVLMDDSNGKWNYTSNPVVADNWKTKLGYYSISIAVNNF